MLYCIFSLGNAFFIKRCTINLVLVKAITTSNSILKKAVFSLSERHHEFQADKTVNIDKFQLKISQGLCKIKNSFIID